MFQCVQHSGTICREETKLQKGKVSTFATGNK